MQFLRSHLDETRRFRAPRAWVVRMVNHNKSKTNQPSATPMEVPQPNHMHCMHSGPAPHAGHAAFLAKGSTRRESNWVTAVHALPTFLFS